MIERPSFKYLNLFIKSAIKKYIDLKPSIAKALLAKTRNGSSVTANIAGIESIANTKSMNSTITSTMNSKYITDAFTITGSHNNVTTTQLGFNGSATTAGHYINTSIIGNSNTVSITQDGTTMANRVTLNVTGSSTSTSIVQH